MDGNWLGFEIDFIRALESNGFTSVIVMKLSSLNALMKRWKVTVESGWLMPKPPCADFWSDNKKMGDFDMPSILFLLG